MWDFGACWYSDWCVLCVNATGASSILAHQSSRQVSFSSRNLTVVHRLHRFCCCIKLLTLLSFPEPLGQFSSPNLPQSIFGWRIFKLVQMKGHTFFFQGEKITKWWKCIDEIWNSSPPEPLGQFQSNVAQSNIWWMGFKFFQVKGQVRFQGEMIKKLSTVNLTCQIGSIQ